MKKIKWLYTEILLRLALRDYRKYRTYSKMLDALNSKKPPFSKLDIWFGGALAQKVVKLELRLDKRLNTIEKLQKN